MVDVMDQEFDPAIPLDSIDEHPENPRRGDDGAVAESVGAHGFFGAIFVQRSTGHVIAGNTRLRVMRSTGAETIPGFWLDVDDDQARQIMLIDNRAADRAGYDDEQLVAVLRTLVESEKGLVGTGYDSPAYEMLLQQVDSDDDGILGGSRQGLTPADRSDSYDESDIRSIILPYGGAEFDSIVESLARLRARFEVDTNAEVVAILVSNADDEA